MVKDTCLQEVVQTVERFFLINLGHHLTSIDSNHIYKRNKYT